MFNLRTRWLLSTLCCPPLVAFSVMVGMDWGLGLSLPVRRAGFMMLAILGVAALAGLMVL